MMHAQSLNFLSFILIGVLDESREAHPGRAPRCIFTFPDLTPSANEPLSPTGKKQHFYGDEILQVYDALFSFDYLHPEVDRFPVFAT